jgi:DNA-directed RNA polymerase subunit alpha
MHSEGPKRMTLRATGPGPVTAGQIEAGSDIEILNKDHVLCTLDDGAQVLKNIGETYLSAGDPVRAQDAFRQAVSILGGLHHPDAEVLRAKYLE